MLVRGRNEVMCKALADSLSLPAFILFFTMMGFGSLAQSAGFDAGMAVIATLLIWGLPGQLAMVELTATGQGLAAIVFACSLANARFMPMVVSFIPAMARGGAGLGRQLLDAQMLSINSWAVCLREFPDIEPAYRHLYYRNFAGSILFATRGLEERLSMLAGCAIVAPAHWFLPSVDLLATGLVGGSLGFAIGRFWRRRERD